MNLGFLPNYEHSKGKKTNPKEEGEKGWEEEQLVNSFRRRDKNLTLNGNTVSSVTCTGKVKEGNRSLQMPDRVSLYPLHKNLLRWGPTHLHILMSTEDFHM